jgi:uncharacterized short protein YbdD (DUF466 family)
MNIREVLTRAWRGFRTLTGDDAYERYVEHVRRAHADETPLDPASFHRQREEQRFNGGVNRCC